MAILKAGTMVRLIQPIIQGEVTGAEIIDGQVQYKVEYTDVAGQRQERFFTEDAVEVVV